MARMARTGRMAARVRIAYSVTKQSLRNRFLKTKIQAELLNIAVRLPQIA
jgi:hypothetical protein